MQSNIKIKQQSKNQKSTIYQLFHKKNTIRKPEIPTSAKDNLKQKWTAAETSPASVARYPSIK